MKPYLFSVDTQWELATIAIRRGGGDQLPELEPSLQVRFPQSSPRTILRQESQNGQDGKDKEQHHHSHSNKAVKD
jgi:hypothetical protein